METFIFFCPRGKLFTLKWYVFVESLCVYVYFIKFANGDLSLSYQELGASEGMSVRFSSLELSILLSIQQKYT